MPAAAKGVEDLRVFFLPGNGRHNCCLDAPKRNSNGDEDASKESEARQACLLPSSEIHSEVGWGNRKTIKSFKKDDRGCGYIGCSV